MRNETVHEANEVTTTEKISVRESNSTLDIEFSKIQLKTGQKFTIFSPFEEARHHEEMKP